jgi:3-methyl-2-oxobutanoate hydroxymethyltransferase
MNMILVGDSLGMCVYGYEGTVPVTMDQCIWHSDAVRRGAPTLLLSETCLSFHIKSALKKL